MRPKRQNLEDLALTNVLSHVNPSFQHVSLEAFDFLQILSLAIDTVGQ